MKSGENSQGVSEKKTFKDSTILYLCVAQEQGQVTSRGWGWGEGGILTVTKKFYYFSHTL